MTSQPGKHSQAPRSAVLGTALGGAAAAALPGAAHAEQPVQARGRPGSCPHSAASHPHFRSRRHLMTAPDHRAEMTVRVGLQTCRAGLPALASGRRGFM
jgi:hypothetical protein